MHVFDDRSRVCGLTRQGSLAGSPVGWPSYLQILFAGAPVSGLCFYVHVKAALLGKASAVCPPHPRVE